MGARADESPVATSEELLSSLPGPSEHENNSSTLAVDCWSLATSETDLERMERVMAHVLTKLREAGATLPDPIKRLETEVDARVAGCYVYSFGSRRLHVAVREGEGQKLSLVVRAGVGFFDFVEFVQKNGASEHAKQQKHSVGERASSRGSATRVVRAGRRQS